MSKTPRWVDRPEFLENCFRWKKKGYALKSRPPVDLSDEKSLSHSDPWIVLACVLEHAKQGEFAHLVRLRGLAADRHVEPTLCGASWDLICDAGSRRDLEYLANLIISEDLPQSMQAEGCFALVSAGELWLVEYMLECWKGMSRLADQRSVETSISRMLEPEGDGMELAHGEYSAESYEALVIARYNQRLREVGSDEVPVLEGAVVDIPTIVWRMRRYIEVGDHGYMWRLRRKFEAYTGVDCSSFFDERESLNVDEVLRVLDVFEATRPSAAERFEPGRRYFFGHPVPR